MPAVHLRATAVLCLVLLAPGVAAPLELPPPPEGYSWARLDDVGGALLVPAGWSFLRFAKDDALSYFATREQFTPPETFDVGITYSVLRDVPGKTGLKPTDFAQGLVQAAQRTKSTAEMWTSEAGAHLKGWGILYSETYDDVEHRFYNLAVANDATGTVHVVIFEAPAEQWAAEWPVARTSLEQIYMDDEY